MYATLGDSLREIIEVFTLEASHDVELFMLTLSLRTLKTTSSLNNSTAKSIFPTANGVAVVMLRCDIRSGATALTEAVKTL